ncbi:MAG: hypothetical protein HY366_03030 [Candidatus Aenigmarchaeota archaeon]|nr:hypothetical protein [Candidatus Aenigmarchaeota archaeon]
MLESLFMRSRKGQAAIEYLMNYAWAIALIIIVGVAIFGLNIGGIRNSLTAQSSQISQAGEQISVIGYKCDSNGNVTVSIQNNGAGLAKSIAVGVVPNSSTGYGLGEPAGVVSSNGTLACASTSLFPAQTTTCITGGPIKQICASKVGQTYTLMVNLSYIDDTTGITFKPVRNFTGILQSA